MNPEYPPLTFATPQIRPYRQGKRGFKEPPPIPADERRRRTIRIQQEIAEVQQIARQLTPEQRRTVFLKLRHNRPLTKTDLSATGLVLMGASGEDESLAVSRDENFDRFAQRIGNVAETPGTGKPLGTALALALDGVTIGDPMDRLSQELLDLYEGILPQDFFKYEIEISSFQVSPKQREAEVLQILEQIHTRLGRGIHGAVYEHELLGAGARVVLWSTGALFGEFVVNPLWHRKITWFDARPRFLTQRQVLEPFNVGNVTFTAPIETAETICVIDSGVARGNPFLEHVLRAEISRSFVYGCSATTDAHGHGSAVASLAAYYQLEYAEGMTNDAKAFIASARIMTDDGELDVIRLEDVVADRNNQARLLSSILKELVEHYSRLGIKIFVLAFEMRGHSYSLANRRLVARNAWIARSIDLLSRQYDVLFVNITGNLSTHDIQDLYDEAAYPQYLLRPFAKLLDPGPAALAITVGSVAHSATTEVATHPALARVGMPSPFTRSGPGFGDSPKPDFVERGGNLIRDPATGAVFQNGGTNVVVATGEISPALHRVHGTSFAAPRVAHQAALLLQDLRSANIDPTAALMRALLALSARRTTESCAFANEDDNSAVVGFGQPSGLTALDCSRSSVILYWQGEMPVDSTAIFRVHVPVALVAARRGCKRITVAIATTPRVQQWGLAEYLGAEAQFRLYRGDRDPDVIQAALQRENRDERNVAAPQTEPDFASSIGVGLNRRSRGTLQRDIFEWQDHYEQFSAHDYTLAVTLRKASWEKDDAHVPVAVVVRLEDTTDRCQTLYTAVRASVQTRART